MKRILTLTICFALTIFFCSLTLIPQTVLPDVNPPEKNWEFYKTFNNQDVYFAIENYQGEFYLFVRYGVDSEEEKQYQVILTREEAIGTECSEKNISAAQIEGRLQQMLNVVLSCTAQESEESTIMESK
ncbi:hypothetical protein [Sediminitomix flava]|uniref:Uncharacterized protein n=1 Tax=Sediminitomix flava TaxID=379075 RepID=A0A315ZHP0_SEDFL|nr:hypothetical protein [Sediminitomix flava]PWJ44812.1 hypothetical protein BC781_1011190 [Sediminitomix flava]